MKWIIALALVSCATAHQRAADQAALRDESAHAIIIRNPMEQLDGRVASDELGGHYQIASVTKDEICFRVLIPSETGTEMQVHYQLTAIEADGAQRTTHQRSALLLGVDQQTTLDAVIRPEEGLKEALGMNQSGSAQDADYTCNAQNMAQGVGGFENVGSYRDPLNAAGLSDDYERVRSYSASNVCFDKHGALTPRSRALVIQRGELSLLNPHALRAVWRLAPIAAHVVPAPKPVYQHADPFGAVQ